MIKYTDTRVTFSEVPDEITLCINISNCPNACPGCHSSYLAGDIGKELTPIELRSLINKNEGITCVSLMGGDNDPKGINDLLMSFLFYSDPVFLRLKRCWYSGCNEISKLVDLNNLDYVKIGLWKEECGPLNNPNTNQKFFKVNHENENALENITYKFWK